MIKNPKSVTIAKSQNSDDSQPIPEFLHQPGPTAESEVRMNEENVSCQKKTVTKFSRRNVVTFLESKL